MDKSKDESKPVVNNNYGLASMILGICSIVVPFWNCLWNFSSCICYKTK